MKNSEKEKLLNSLDNIIKQSYKIEHEFKELKSIVKDVIEFLPDALWVFDKNGEIFIQNSHAKKITPLVTKINSNIKSMEIKHNGKIYLVKNINSHDKLIISATDITEQKRSERLTSMGQIAAHLAHEIRNPIGAISLFTGILLKKVQANNIEIVQEIQKAVHRVDRIIKSTLLFTKGVNIQKKEISLKELQLFIEKSFEQYSKTKEINLSFNFNDQKIIADFDLLCIVMQNFLYNAIDAIEEDEKEEGDIYFSFEKNYFVIKDNGVKIKDKNILYEPFKSTKLKGTGLGLALSFEIIKAHNGKIEILDKEKGFKIYLPYKEDLKN